MKFLLALVSALLISLVLPQPASATDVKISCTPPVTNTDGTAITAAQGALTFNLYGSLTGQPRLKLVTGTTSCSFTRTSVPFGTQEYQATAIALNVESDMSNTASVVIPPPKPGAPTNAVVVTLVAYEMRGSATTGDLRMVSVGYMPEGTQCLQTTATIGQTTYQQVDKAQVDLYNAVTKLPPVLWAKCA